MPSFLNNDFAYCLAVNILYGLALITNIGSLLHGLNLKTGINFDFPVTVSSLVVDVYKRQGQEKRLCES